MSKHLRFFFGLLFPIFILVAVVRVVMNDMQFIAGIWSVYTLVITVGGALIGTILEAKMSDKPKKSLTKK